MEYMRGWRALFNDPEWSKKLLVGSVLLLSGLCIPLIGQLVLTGYAVLAERRAVQGQDRLPRLDFNFDYLGKLIGLGFKPMIARFAYGMALTIPLVIVFYCFFGMSVAIMGNAGDVGGVIGGVLMLFAFVLYMIAIIAVQAVTAIASLRASLMEDLGAALAPKAVLRMTRLLLSELIIGGFVITLITVPIILVGELLFFIGLFPAAVIVTHIYIYFGAELYKRYLEKGGEPLPVGPMEVPGFEEGAPAPAPL
jgi:hypothetical protein